MRRQEPYQSGSGGPTGWTEVHHWCKQHAGALDEVLEPDIGYPVDLLVIAIDVDIAIEAGIADPPQQVGGYETNRLRDVMRTWLQTDKRRRFPNCVVVSTPVMATETWILKALYPRTRSPEGIRQPAHLLVQKKKLRLSPKDGKPWKELHLYRQYAGNVASSLEKVRTACPEAERTCREIERIRDTVS